MANRFPLVLDTGDGNKIKELPSGDNLNLRESSIVNVQDVNALGTINAADITVNGNRLVAQTFSDLTDTPNTFAGAADYFVKVKEDGTGLEFRPFSDIGNIEVESIEVSDIILPTANDAVDIGNSSLRFRTVAAREFRGDLLAGDNTRVFDSSTGRISYAALQGAPQFLSEFADDIGFLRSNDLDDALGELFDDGVPFATDIKGSVFADDSSVIIDGVAGVIRGDTQYTGTGFIRGQTVVILADGYVQLGQTELLSTLEPEIDGTGSIGTDTRRFGAGYFDVINVPTVETESVQSGLGTGIGIISSSTDISITAGNRVRIEGNVPFRVSITTDADQLSIAAQAGDLIYNTTQDLLQIYQNDAWIGLHTGIFTGNVTAATGTSSFNNIVIAGDLTVNGTTTSIDTTNTTISDNIIVLNDGELGAGVTAGTSGIEIDRGSESNVTFLWNDTIDKWTVGTETLVATTFEGNLTGNVTGNVTGNTSGTHTGSVVGDVTGNLTGNVVGDLVGSVFGDDSTILVDAVNNTIPGLLTGAWSNLGNTFNVSGDGLIVTAPASSLLFNDSGLITAFNDGTNSSSYSMSSTSFSAALGDGTNNAAYSLSDTGISAAISDDSNSLAFDVNAGGVSISTTGQVIAAITGDVGIVSNGDFTVTANNIAISTSGISANITGNIDNAALTIGATTATTIAIGNAGSTTTINGTVSLSALVAGSITADDSISITTATGDGNAISIGPDGTNTFVNLTADNIRFFGPITQNINAQAGITGDLKGSIFGDDSTILVDAVNSIIPYGVLDGAPANLSDFNNNLDYAAIVGTAIQNNGLPVNTFLTGELDAQNNDIVDANLVNATGTLDGDVVGSVFADDSSIMVDAVNFTMFTDAMTLTPLNAEPLQLVSGMLVAADGVSWDPAAKVGAVPYPVFYDGVAWNALY